MTVERRQIEARLDEIIDPCSAANGTNLSIVEMGLVAAIEVDSSHVTVSMRLTSPFCMQIPYFIDEIDAKVGDLEGVSSVDIETDQGREWHYGMMSQSAQEQRRARKSTRIEQLRNETRETVTGDD